MIKLELSEQMVQTIGNALNEAPYRVAAPVINELQRQINEQQQKVNKNEDDSS